MSIILGTLETTVDPKVVWSFRQVEVRHELQSGNLGFDVNAVKFIYTLNYEYLSPTEYNTLEAYTVALGNNENITLSFTWKDRIHDGATTNANIGRILNKVKITAISITDVYGDGTSEINTGKAVQLTLEEV